MPSPFDSLRSLRAGSAGLALFAVATRLAMSGVTCRRFAAGFVTEYQGGCSGAVLLDFNIEHATGSEAGPAFCSEVVDYSFRPLIPLGNKLVPLLLHFLNQVIGGVWCVQSFQKTEGRHWNNIATDPDEKQDIGNSSFHSDESPLDSVNVSKRNSRILN